MMPVVCTVQYGQTSFYSSGLVSGLQGFKTILGFVKIVEM